MRKVLMVLLILVVCVGTANATPLGNGPAIFGSTSLQGIMNDVFGKDVISAVNDQSDVRVWNTVDGASTAFEVIYLAGNTNSIGVYDYVTGSKAALGLNSGASAASSTLVFTGGNLLINGYSANGAWSGSFGFYLDSFDDTSTTTFYTEDDQNGGATQAVSYLIPDGTGYDLSGSDDPDYEGMFSDTSGGDDDWLIAFEDVAYASSDKDFNDAVFYVKDMAPVPEPGTLLLLGGGLVGLAYLRKRKKA